MQKYLDISNKFINFTPWIERTCKPFDKGKLTAFPRFKLCQHNFKNVSTMLKYEELPEVNSERWLSLEDLEGEIWKPVEGYEYLLSISNYGRVKREEHFLEYKDGRKNRYKPIIYRPAMKQGGYLGLSINIKGKMEYFCVHRLVALAFIPNPNNFPIVNHKDENPTNNVVYNLEWCTTAYNNTYGTVGERKKQSFVKNGIAKSVLLYDYIGHLIEKYDTIHDVMRSFGISKCAITLCCDGKSTTALGLHLRYSTDVYKKRDISNLRKIYVIINGESRTLSSLSEKEAIENINIIRNCIYSNGVEYKKNNIVSLLKINSHCTIIRIINKRRIIFEYLKT